jgi:hypothetical protein
MLQCQPQARLIQIAGVGHAPTLMDPEQISLVTDFLVGQVEQDSYVLGR